MTKSRIGPLWRKAVVLITLLYSLTPIVTVFAHDHGDAAAANDSGPSSSTINTSIGSLIFVLLVIVLLVFRLRRSGAGLSTMTGMMATMAAAMLSSLVVGTIAGILLKGLFFSTVIGVTFGMIVGYVSGCCLSLLASMEGMLSGIMGGMMGAMLGVMGINDHPTLTVIFMVLVFAASLSFLYKLIDTEEFNANQANTEN